MRFSVFIQTLCLADTMWFVRGFALSRCAVGRSYLSAGLSELLRFTTIRLIRQQCINHLFGGGSTELLTMLLSVHGRFSARAIDWFHTVRDGRTHAHFYVNSAKRRLLYEKYHTRSARTERVQYYVFVFRIRTREHDGLVVPVNFHRNHRMAAAGMWRTANGFCWMSYLIIFSVKGGAPLLLYAFYANRNTCFKRLCRRPTIIIIIDVIYGNRPRLINCM